uniref:Polyprotein protein n=1 Tax=Solanum tuberosum TaxID=4113 RepID=M1DMB6_SOLTU
MEILDTDILAHYDVPPATTEDKEETVFEGLTDLEETMVHSVVQTSLRDTIMAGSSAATVVETPGTDAQLQSVTLGIDAPTDRVTKQT